ncbi:MAG: Hsp20/alpha crystallin family protein [Desulforhopalus sp.]
MWSTRNDIERMYGAMDLLRSRMNSVFASSDRLHGHDYGWKIVNGGPRINLHDTGNKIQITAEVPGMTNNDLNIKIQGNYMELNGKRIPDAPEGYKAHRVERETIEFTRTLTLPADVDADKIEAVLKDGLLTLVLPKAEAAKPKQISIR